MAKKKPLSTKPVRVPTDAAFAMILRELDALKTRIDNIESSLKGEMGAFKHEVRNELRAVQQEKANTGDLTKKFDVRMDVVQRSIDEKLQTLPELLTFVRAFSKVAKEFK